MRSIINANLFKHMDSSSDALNNLCTVIHKLKSEGYYRGELFINKHFLGSFKIYFDKKIERSQVNIDASLFDPSHEMAKERTTHDLMLDVGMEGYVVLHVSGHQEGVYLKLSKLEENKRAEEYFDSRKLQQGDMVVFRVLYPGEYTITNTLSTQVHQFQVKEQKEYSHPDKLQPLNIGINEKSFDVAKTDVSPLQPIIIKIETEAALKLEMKKEKPPKKKEGKKTAK